MAFLTENELATVQFGTLFSYIDLLDWKGYSYYIDKDRFCLFDQGECAFTTKLVDELQIQLKSNNFAFLMSLHLAQHDHSTSV